MREIYIDVQYIQVYDWRFLLAKQPLKIFQLDFPQKTLWVFFLSTNYLRWPLRRKSFWLNRSEKNNNLVWGWTIPLNAGKKCKSRTGNCSFSCRFLCFSSLTWCFRSSRRRHRRPSHHLHMCILQREKVISDANSAYFFFILFLLHAHPPVSAALSFCSAGPESCRVPAAPIDARCGREQK